MKLSFLTGLFCWDGSFASYMLSLDSLDWSFSNLIQIIKMRTSAGFIPSYSAGTKKTRDRSNPPVTAKILHEITKRWGANKTQWVVELCFDDLLNWNTWMWTRRTETPLGLLTWGTASPPPYQYPRQGSEIITVFWHVFGILHVYSWPKSEIQNTCIFQEYMCLSEP